ALDATHLPAGWGIDRRPDVPPQPNEAIARRYASATAELPTPAGAAVRSIEIRPVLDGRLTSYDRTQWATTPARPLALDRTLPSSSESRSTVGGSSPISRVWVDLGGPLSLTATGVGVDEDTLRTVVESVTVQ